MDFDPELWLRIKDKKVSAHQLGVLSALAETGSQNRAAALLGISVPVLHRHLKNLENKLEINLVSTSASGSRLTSAGRSVLRIYSRYLEMLAPEEGTVLCCTPVTYELLMMVVTQLEREGKKFHISVNDDTQNLKALYLGRADLVIFDDPQYAMEFEVVEERASKILTLDLFPDTLVHVDTGVEYVKLRYGAQRLGFRYLEAEQRPYKVLYELCDYKQILSSGKSFFINHSIINRKNIRLSSSSDPKIYVHPVMAVSINPTDELRELAIALSACAHELGYGWEG
jgi:molybdenum-dependent DNA-binding transcriptional regulator ModE